MAKVTINPGICGFKTVIKAVSTDGQHAEVKINTACPNLKPFEQLTTLDAYNECFKRPFETEVYKLANDCVKHPACPVPCGMIKALEVACGLALPKDVQISVEKD